MTEKTKFSNNVKEIICEILGNVWKLENRPFKDFNDISLGDLLDNKTIILSEIYSRKLLNKEKEEIENVLNNLDKETFDKEMKVNDLSFKEINKRVKVKVQVQSISDVKLLPRMRTVSCYGCDECVGYKDCKGIKLPIKLLNEFYDLSKYKKPYYKHKFVCFKKKKTTDEEGKKHYIFPTMHINLKYINCYILDVIDPPSSFTNELKADRKTRSVYYVTNEKLNGKLGLVEIVGKVIPIGQNDMKNFVIFSQSVTPLQEYFLNFKLTDKDYDDFKKYFYKKDEEGLKQQEEEIDGTIAPWIVGRKLAKNIGSLAQFTPLYQSNNDLGYGRVLFVGDSRCGKTEIVKDMTLNLSPLGTEYVLAESAKRTGISYTVTKNQKTGEYQIRWGVLVNCDGMMAGLDGLHKWDEQEIMQLREALSQGIISVRVVINGDANARTRLLAVANLNQPIYMYANRFAATKGADILNQVDRYRWDFIIPFGQSDVLTDDITKISSDFQKGLIKRQIPEDIYKKFVMWAWNIKPSQIKVSEECENLIKEKVNSLFNEYAKYETIRPFSNEFFKIFRKYCIACAIRSFSYNITDRVVELYNFQINYIYTTVNDFLKNYLDIDEAMSIETERENDLNEVKTKILSSEPLLKIFKEIVLNQGISQSTIVEKLGYEKGNLSKYTSQLESFKLIDKRTMVATETGMKLFKSLKGIYTDFSRKLYNITTIPTEKGTIIQLDDRKVGEVVKDKYYIFKPHYFEDKKAYACSKSVLEKAKQLEVKAIVVDDKDRSKYYEVPIDKWLASEDKHLFEKDDLQLIVYENFLESLKEDIEDTSEPQIINLACYMCGELPSAYYNSSAQGKPICQSCYDAKKFQQGD